MQATTPDPWLLAEDWIRTTTGQEFCDELVWGSVGNETLDALLRSWNINVNDKNRQRLINLANAMMSNGEA